jgi:hypothetical protein
MNKNEGLCPRRDKKNKLNSKTKFKKKGRAESEARYIALDAILLRRPRSAGPFPRASPRFPKKKAKFKIEKEVARRTRTQKIKK